MTVGNQIMYDCDKCEDLGWHYQLKKVEVKCDCSCEINPDHLTEMSGMAARFVTMIVNSYNKTMQSNPSNDDYIKLMKEIKGICTLYNRMADNS